VSGTVATGDLDEAELADITRECGLSDVEAPLLEQIAELFLRGDPMRLNQLANRGVAFWFIHAVSLRVVVGASQAVM
jgi:hypothetical protein